MTQEEITAKAFEAYPKPAHCDYPNDDYYENAVIVRSIQRDGYIKALKDINTLRKIEGWLARNKEHNELIFVPGPEPPTRMHSYWFAGFTWGYCVIHSKAFPDITWESEPRKVELIIKEQ